MQTRNTGIMAVVLLLLAGFVYFYEIRGRGEREEAERVASLLLRFEPDDVTALVVETEEGRVRATRGDGGWSIVEPIAVPADGEAFDTLVDRLHEASHERLVSEAVDDLAPFELAAPRVRITIELADGATQVLAVGKDTPVGFNVYATVGDGGDVYSAPASLKSSVDKKLYDLRDRTVLAFTEDAVRAIEMERGATRIAVERQPAASPDEDPQWSATTPFTGRADGETIEDLLSELHTGEAAGWVMDSAPSDQDLVSYGLDRPSAAVTLRTQDDTQLRLLIGDESAEPAGRYAMREGGDAVFVVDSSLIEAIPEDADDLRNRQVVALARERVRTIDIEAPGQDPIAIRRAGSDWTVTAPRPLDADASSVSRILSAVQDLRAEGFAPRASGSDPLTVRLGLGDDDSAEPTESVQLRILGSTTIDPDEEGDEPIEVAYATTEGDPTVYLVPMSDVEDLSPSLFDLRAKTLVEFSQSDLTEVDVEAGDRTFALRKEGESWTLEGATVETDTVSDLLWDLNFLRMEAVVAEWDDAEPALAPYGLDAPRYRVRARTAEGDVADVTIGVEVPSGEEASERVYAQIGGHAAVYEVTVSVADALAALVEALQS